MRSRNINRILLILSFLFGLIHFYWWLVAPPLLSAGLSGIGMIAMPRNLVEKWKAEGRYRPWQALLLGSLTLTLGSAAIFAVGWLLRLAGNWVVSLMTG